MQRSKSLAVLSAISAAALYAISIPFSKRLLTHIGPTMTAAFLYLGAGVGLFLFQMLRRLSRRKIASVPLTRRDFPFTAAMVLLDIAAPILLMFGLSNTTAANASLLNNFEIVATSLIALLLFHELLSRRLWLVIILVTAASILLGFEGADSLSFHGGSLLILGACVCWGFENNCTRMLSSKSSVEIVTIKGCFSGLGSLMIAVIVGESFPSAGWSLVIMALGFVSYGISICLYILAQRHLGAAKTSAFYSIAPFLGVLFGMLLGERPAPLFYLALALMILSTMLMVRDTAALQHLHPHTHVHTHPHYHNGILHTHPHAHTHSHLHEHGADTAAHRHHHLMLYHHRHSHSAV